MNESLPSAEKDADVKRCVGCGQPARGYSSYCQPCHFDAFEGGADIG